MDHRAPSLVRLSEHPQDAMVWLVALATVATVIALVVSAFRDRQARWPLLGVVALATLLRHILSHHQIMGVNPFSREHPWIWHLTQIHAPLFALFPDGTSNLEVVSGFNFVLSIVVLPIVHLHAASLLGSTRQGLLVAALLALSPMAIGFARSEVMFFGSMVAISASLAALDCAVRTRGAPAVLWVLGALATFWAAIEARPLSALLAIVMTIHLWRRSRAVLKRPPGIALLCVIWGLTGLAAMNVLDHGQISDAPGAGTSLAAFHITPIGLVIGVVSNNYLGPSLTPAWTTACVLAGVIALRRRPEVRRYLAVWFFVFFGAHLVVTSETKLIAARYGLHSIVPVLITAAVGLESLVERFVRPRHRWEGAAFALFALVTTALTTHWFSPIDDDENDEYAFLRRLWEAGHPSAGATVVEVQQFGDRYGASRYPRFGLRVDGAHQVSAVHTAPTSGHYGNGPARSGAPESDGPTYLFLGLPCLWYAQAGHELHQACEGALANGRWEPVATISVDAPMHDPHGDRRAPAGRKIGLFRQKELAPTDR